MEKPMEKEPLVLKNGALCCHIAGNEPWKEHCAGYNGISRLTHTACEESPFVSSYAGINMEFFFDGFKHDTEPRWLGKDNNRQPTPTEVKYSGRDRATIHWRETPSWGVEAWVSFQVVAPHYVDIVIRLQPRKRSFRHGYMGAFFASYIADPEKKEFYFWGREANASSSGWQTSNLTPGKQTAYYPSAEERDGCFGEEFFFGPRSSRVFEKPLMFGLWRNMVLAWFFDSADNLRLAYNARGGGEQNPAWDFALFVPNYRERRIYFRSLRLMFKPFIDPDDVMREYEVWSRSR